jgi:hypothetical protein
MHLLDMAPEIFETILGSVSFVDLPYLLQTSKVVNVGARPSYKLLTIYRMHSEEADITHASNSFQEITSKQFIPA